MAKQSGTEVVQCELSTPHATPGSDTRFVLWVEASLKPSKGMVLVRPNDERRWEVTQAYTKNVQRMDGINTGFKTQL